MERDCIRARTNERTLETVKVFKKLDRGELSPFDVSDAIHLFHNGVCRELYVQYIISGIDYESLVSSAVVRGTIAREELPAELSEFLEEQINLIQKR